jgi:biotin transport system permease protein
MTVGLYRPGRSVIHRLAPEWKVLAVFAGGTLLVLTQRLDVLGLAAVCALLLHALARIPWRVVFAQVRPMLPVVVLLGAVQWITSGPRTAVAVVVRLMTLILLAALATLTTRVSDMVQVAERALRPLERVGVSTAKVSLAISMALRFIPLLTQVVHDVREAQQARGLERNMFALAVPVLVRALHTADQVAEAIDARSGGD